MANFASILNQRFLKKDKNKTTALAEKTSDGGLSSFAGIFNVTELNEGQKEKLSDLLKKYAPDQTLDIAQDLSQLLAISSEVRAINNQAVMLHGERIKRAQDILKKYRDGAFSSWLVTTYGNRQTPYNFLQYYEFYAQMPTALHPQIETMPRQAVYTLASREGEIEKKEEIVRNYKGETKQQLLTLIRSHFPLDEDDKRREDVALMAIASLERLKFTFQTGKVKLASKQKTQLLALLRSLKEQISNAEEE
jgi:hypothetical protein